MFWACAIISLQGNRIPQLSAVKPRWSESNRPSIFQVTEQTNVGKENGMHHVAFRKHT